MLQRVTFPNSPTPNLASETSDSQRLELRFATVTFGSVAVFQKDNSEVLEPTVLTPQQVAERLQLPVSWIYENTRNRGQIRNADPIPHLKLGRYIRFKWTDVEEWLNRQNRNAAAKNGA